MDTNSRLLTYHVYDKNDNLIVTHKVFSQWANVIIDIYLKWKRDECPFVVYLEVNGKKIRVRQDEFRL